jgi:hypothetical protein
MGDRSPIDRLRSIAAACEGGALGDDGRWLASRLRNYISTTHRGGTLDMALELVPLPGGEPWWATEARQRRDDALRKLAATHYATHPAPARAIAEAATRYSASAWRFDQHRAEPPESYAGTERAVLFTILKAGPAPTERHLRRILANGADMKYPLFMSVTDPDSPLHGYNGDLGHEHHAAASTA